MNGGVESSKQFGKKFLCRANLLTRGGGIAD